MNLNSQNIRQINTCITLPKRILGQACGLLHQCIFEDLLAIDLFFKRSTSDKAVNDNSLLLSNAVHPANKTTKCCFSFLLLSLLSYILGKDTARIPPCTHSFRDLPITKTLHNSIWKVLLWELNSISPVNSLCIRGWIPAWINCGKINQSVNLMFSGQYTKPVSGNMKQKCENSEN